MTAQVNFDFQRNNSVIPALTSLCSKTVVQNSEFIKTCCKSLPLHIYEEFMSYALRNDHTASALELIKIWPHHSLAIRNLFPPDFDNFRMIYDYAYKEKCDKIKTKIAIGIKTLFQVTLMLHPPSNLQILDLRGYQMSVNMLLSFMEQFPSRDLIAKDYDLVVDCYFTEETSVKKLMDIHAKISEKIYLHCNTVAPWSEKDNLTLQYLLQLSNHKALKRVSIHSQYLAISTFDTPPLVVFWRNQNVTELQIFYDLKHDKENMQHKHRIYQIMPNIFKRLQYLNRLELWDFPVTGNIHHLLPLPGISRLDCLSLINCKLANSDLIYLSTASLALRILSLRGDNVLTQRIDLLVKLLRSSSSTLTILILENCINSDDVIPSLITGVLSLKKLRFFSFRARHLSWNCLRDNISLLGSMEQLECVNLDHYTRYKARELEHSFENNRSPPVLVKWANYDLDILQFWEINNCIGANVP